MNTKIGKTCLAFGLGSYCVNQSAFLRIAILTCGVIICCLVCLSVCLSLVSSRQCSFCTVDLMQPFVKS